MLQNSLGKCLPLRKNGTMRLEPLKSDEIPKKRQILSDRLKRIGERLCDFHLFFKRLTTGLLFTKLKKKKKTTHTTLLPTPNYES